MPGIFLALSYKPFWISSCSVFLSVPDRTALHLLLAYTLSHHPTPWLAARQHGLLTAVYFCICVFWARGIKMRKASLLLPIVSSVCSVDTGALSNIFLELSWWIHPIKHAYCCTPWSAYTMEVMNVYLYLNQEFCYTILIYTLHHSAHQLLRTLCHCLTAVGLQLHLWLVYHICWSLQ